MIFTTEQARAGVTLSVHCVDMYAKETTPPNAAATGQTTVWTSFLIPFFVNRIYWVAPGREVKVDIDILSKTKYWLTLDFAALLAALSENSPPGTT